MTHGVATKELQERTLDALTAPTAPNWLAIAAETEDAVLGGAGGGIAGDRLHALLVVPASLSPGAVAIADGAGDPFAVFEGGEASLVSLEPFEVPLGLVSNDGAWKVTTGADVSAVARGAFTFAPAIGSSAAVSLAENLPLEHLLQADQKVEWSIVGGADAAQFELAEDGKTLRWADDGVQDYEAPADADDDNDYVVDVRATNPGTGLHADQTITVTVEDEAEG